MRHRFRIACATGLAAYAVFLLLHVSTPRAGSEAASGLFHAHMLRDGRLAAELRTVPEFPPVEPRENTPAGMTYSARLGGLVPTAPIGLPACHAIAATVTGWRWGPTLFGVLMTCGTVVATFDCVRQTGARRELAAVAAIALAACPIVLDTTIELLDVSAASVCWTTFAMALALRAARSKEGRWSVAAGICFAVAVLIRPSNMALLPVLVVALRQVRLMGGALVGALPLLSLLAWYNHLTNADPFTIGYGSVETAFAWEHVAGMLRGYLVGLPVFLPVGAAGLVLLPWLPWRTRRREIAVLLLWICAFVGFNASHAPAGNAREDLQVVLPAFPALLALAALAVEWILTPLSTARCIVVGRGAVALALVLSFAASAYQWHAREPGDRDDAGAETLTRWADANLPQDAVILTTSSSRLFYLHTKRAIVRADVISRSRFESLTALAQARHWPVHALLAQNEESMLNDRLSGRWIEERRLGAFGVWRLAFEPGVR